jgi:aryl-alcohol dehydrogenase-like predicted oxidoreductase
MTMKRRKLGEHGPEVSAIGLGCMYYGAVDRAEAERTIRGVLDRGVTLLDTADAYDQGQSEEIVGSVIQGRRRDSLCVATKFGIRGRNPDGTLKLDGSPVYVREACEASLRRLNISTIDLYYLHRLDPAVPIEETVGAMSELVRDGLVRHLGLSEVGPETLRRAHAVHPVAALQSEYSLWSRDLERSVLAVCRQLGIGLVAYSPLGRGFLAGAVRDTHSLGDGDIRSRMGERFATEALAHNLVWLEQLEALARDNDCSIAQLALGWLLQAGDDIVPIPGTRSLDKAAENIGAVDLALSPETWREVESIVERGRVQGMRLPAALLAQLGG